MTDQQHEAIDIRQYLGYAAIGLGGIGALMQFATVTLLTGDTIYWVGAVLAFGGTVLAWLNGRLWIKVATVVLTALCVVNVMSTESKLNNERQQLNQIITNSQTN